MVQKDFFFQKFDYEEKDSDLDGDLGLKLGFY